MPLIKLGSIAPTRREIFIIIIAGIVFLVYFNAHLASDASWDMSSLSSLREQLPSFLGGGKSSSFTAEVPISTYTRLFGHQFAISMRDAQQSWATPGARAAVHELQSVDGARIAKVEWGSNVPETSVVASMPGWSIFDSVVVLNGTMYFVTDDAKNLPPLNHVAIPPEDASRLGEIRTINITNAAATFGDHAARIDGVTWLSRDSLEDVNIHTLFAMQKLYSSLDPSIQVDGTSLLSRPKRLMVHRVTGDDLKGNPKHFLNTQTARAMLEGASLERQEEWNDLVTLAAPFILDRVLISDSKVVPRVKGYGVSSVDDLGDGPHPSLRVSWSPPLFLENTSPHWWAPMRTAVAHAADAVPPAPKRHTITCYVPAQAKSFLETALGARKDVELAVVDPTKTPWRQRMQLVMRSTVLLAASGDFIGEALFLTPGRGTLIELFPATSEPTPDMALAVQSINVGFVGVLGNRTFAWDNVPLTKPDSPVHFDGDAIVRIISGLLPAAPR